jgi:hypothetical protein
MSHKTNAVHRFEDSIHWAVATSGDFAESSKTVCVMTHSLTTVAEALLGPERLYRVAELRELPTRIPQQGGVYAWWFSKAPPAVSIDNTAIHESRRLLYVGIAPRKPSAAGSVSGGTRHNVHKRGEAKDAARAGNAADRMDGRKCPCRLGGISRAVGDRGSLNPGYDTLAAEHPWILRSVRQGTVKIALANRSKACSGHRRLIFAV